MIFEYQNFASLGVNLNRQKYGPLDISAVLTSEADLKYYITKGEFTEGVSEYWYTDENTKVVPYPYEGQILATVIDGKANVYVLELGSDGALKAKPLADESAAAAIAELESKFDELSVSVQTNTDNITSLQTKTTDIENVIGTAATDTEEATGLYKAIEDSVYDDSSVISRISSIENDYLKSSDKDELTSDIASAKEAAVNEAVTRVLGEAVSEDFDTLKEVADWIASDTTNSAELINRVTAIENDYLQEADKTAIDESVT